MKEEGTEKIDHKTLHAVTLHIDKNRYDAIFLLVVGFTGFRLHKHNKIISQNQRQTAAFNVEPTHTAIKSSHKYTLSLTLSHHTQLTSWIEEISKKR